MKQTGPILALTAVLVATGSCRSGKRNRARDQSSPAALRFAGRSGPIPEGTRQKMIGVSWHEGCPVPIDALSLLRIRYRGFDGRMHEGQMVVATTVADEVLGIFRQIYEKGFPIERMRLIEAYGGSDDRSMQDNNTSAFNCRTVSGTSRWSQHAFGTAIDINPVQNPYITTRGVEPPAAAAYVDRSREGRGMIVAPGPVTRAFKAARWSWGGDWTERKDYQHFSRSGR